MEFWTSVFGLVALILITEAGALIGAVVATTNISSWYQDLKKPWFTPPNWVFGPAWTTLYFLMATALWIVIRHHRHKNETYHDNGQVMGMNPPTLYIIQLFLNWLWTPIFFGMKKVGLALLEILVLWVAILVTTISFFEVSTFAGVLMIPYLVWTSYATMLNFSIWRLNRASAPFEDEEKLNLNNNIRYQQIFEGSRTS